MSAVFQLTTNPAVAVPYDESPDQITLFELAIVPPPLGEDQRQRRYKGIERWREGKKLIVKIATVFYRLTANLVGLWRFINAIL